MPDSPAGNRSVLAGALNEQRRHIALGAVMVTVWQAGEALVPFLIGVIIDQALSGGAGDLALWLGILGTVYLVLSFSFRFGERFAQRASEQAAHELRLRLTRRVLDDHGGAETGRLPGVLVSIATSDAARVGAVAIAVSAGVAAVVGLLLATVLLVWISLPLGLLVLLGTPPLLWLTHKLGQPLVERSETEQEHGAQAAGIATDLISGLRVLKGLRAEVAALDRYRSHSTTALTATVRAARAEAAYRGIMLLLSGGFLAVIAVTGGVLAARGDITVGQLISSLGLAQFLVGPMSTFAWVNADLAQGRASARRIAEVLQAPPAVPGGSAVPAIPVRGRVTMRGLAGSALRGIDLDVAPGELVGIATTDPAAAAALISYLGREALPDAGAVDLDGVPLADVDPASQRDVMLVSAHHTDLFDGTVRANISASRGGDIEPAVAAATVDEVAQTLPEGLDTQLDEQARTLSGGQRQRVALARALAADPPVLVVHDPTTAVDTVTEARIAAGLRRVREGRTTLLVTTSPALLAATDRVVFIHDGTVTASGRHSELIGANDLYRTAVLA